jgi:hypothetical protein
MKDLRPTDPNGSPDSRHFDIKGGLLQLQWQEKHVGDPFI